jgi:hypothetical protein
MYSYRLLFKEIENGTKFINRYLSRGVYYLDKCLYFCSKTTLQPQLDLFTMTQVVECLITSVRFDIVN